MDDCSGRRPYYQARRIGHTVIHWDRFDGSSVHLERLPEKDLSQVPMVQVVSAPTVGQSFTHQCKCESGSVNRHIDLAQEKGKSSDVVVVTMSQDHGP